MYFKYLIRPFSLTSEWDLMLLSVTKGALTNLLIKSFFWSAFLKEFDRLSKKHGVQASLDKLLIREIQPRFQIIKFNKFFLLLGFSSQTLTIHRTAGKGRGSFLFHSTTSTCSRTLRHLFATLLVR